jgi:putative ABC transport system permease protein
MSLFRLALANLGSSPLSSLVNVLLLALGTASIAILLLASAQLSSTLSRNAAGIDLVIGAKGSPLQLVLAGVYHADVPPGNIPATEVDRWQEHPSVGAAIPLSLGDSFRGYRIVGTVPEFADLYQAKILQGGFWDDPFEAVIGSRVIQTTGLKVGDTLAGVHGLAEDGDTHEDSTYQVVGTFAPTDSVLDSLIVTSTESVWLMHAGHDHHDHEEGHDHEEEHAHEEHEHEHDHDHESHEEDPQHGDEITLLLIQLSSPLGALTLPREINAETGLQAASPAYEITRLLQIVGVGLNWLNAFAVVLVISAALSIFAALYASLRARRHDLAVLRCLGATRGELFYLLFVEGLLLTIAGIIVGLILAHGGVELLGQWLGEGQGIVISGWAWANGEFALVAGLLLTGSVTAMIPAWQAYSTDVARTLTAP